MKEILHSEMQYFLFLLYATLSEADTYADFPGQGLKKYKIVRKATEKHNIFN